MSAMSRTSSATSRRCSIAWGRIDILVNNAALLGGRGLLEEDLDYFDRAVKIAAAGNFLDSKHVAISMIERALPLGERSGRPRRPDAPADRPSWWRPVGKHTPPEQNAGPLPLVPLYDDERVGGR
jgi:NAD(P)-dependent dehydrogenase (short-subunit alcohol dehydrogenase family)